MFNLNCYFFKKKKSLTVGELQSVFCPINLKQKTILQEQKLINKNYPIGLLGYKIALVQKPVIKDDLLSLQVSFYVPGTFTASKPVLQLTKDSFFLSNLNWTTTSILQKTSKAQSFYGPLLEKNSLNALYLSIIVFCLLVFYSIYKFVKKQKYKKTQQQEVNKYKTAISAYHQYHKTIRSIALDSKSFFLLIQSALFVYLTQKLALACFKYPLSHIKIEIKKIKTLNPDLKKALSFLLDDLQVAKTNKNTKNKQNLLNKTNFIVEQLEDLL